MSEQLEKPTAEKVADAERAALSLAKCSDRMRSAALHEIADAIAANHDEILAANERDVAEAEELLEAGEYTQALVDRLKLSESKLESIEEMVRSVAGQDDPLGDTQTARALDDGLELYRVSVPIGVVGTIFESRPDALVQIAALCLRSGNAVILKGGSEASHSNRVLYELIEDATAGFAVDGDEETGDEDAGAHAAEEDAGDDDAADDDTAEDDAGDRHEADDELPDGWAQLIEARADVDTVLEMDDAIDLVMPRGSSEFVEYIQQNTHIPVLGHTEGVCHVYVDDAADLSMASDIAFDAKVQYPAVCNAVETVLVHEAVADEFLPEIAERYREADVEIRGDEQTRAIVDVAAASEEDWDTEYGDLIVAIRVVDSIDDAVDHVATYGSKHTDSIVTEDTGHARFFMRSLDSASVFHNASTRFADGFRYGLGAEVGISTGKIHARGPVGLEGLTTYQYYLEGDGQIVGTYAGADAKPFRHEDFDGEWRPGQLSSDRSG
ncbi:gamma-glutamyl phosphate reductase [Salinarchaeum sp. Harcht-Bsk1]|uniref:glutamate-5-semialdehyde dehydrogenase n=1 Tax=Salinarchaeum sp. Harcht-Bsk1 TaxID=1333523 RepID=UPI000342346F|nr:glutamate-5-semialdehyde dehydrogenase [Salinarchaeum sp. Harcht-Bsk1]AGN02862.1 gamma-glutamyl phosphate reductase [Salinarchaeum sp. Harcht-Bsk1]